MTFWQFVRNSIHRKLFKGINSTFIPLIPKKRSASRVSDFLPISLVTSLYKILAKVLSNGVTDVLYEIIDGTQFAFIKDSNILIAN